MKDQNQVARYAIAGLFSVVLYTGGATTYDAIHARAAAQQNYADKLAIEHERFTKLAPVQQRWKSTYPSADGVQDLYGVLQLLNMPRYHVEMTTQNIQITSIEPISYRGQQLGISRVCLHSAGSAGLPVHAPDYPTLIAAATALAQRPDLTYDSVSIQNAEVPTMTIKNPCLLLRN